MGVELTDFPKPNPKPLQPGQFSQGTLFQQPKPSEQHRWPAGYSPERKAEISGALPTDIKVASTYRYGTGGVFKDPSEFNRGSTRQRASSRRAQARSVLVDTLARSTVPAEDITGQGRHTPNISIESMGSAQGMYSSPGVRVSRRKGVRTYTPQEQGIIKINPSARERSGTEHTILHELGHHVDYETLGQDVFRMRARRRFRGASPSLEGAAEGYAAKHQTPRQGEELHYADVASYKNIQTFPSFQERFAEVSGRTVEEAMAKPQHIGPQFDNQMHLFSRDAPSEVTSHPDYKDYGQHRYYKYWGDTHDETVGSITVGGGAEAGLGLTKRRQEP